MSGHSKWSTIKHKKAALDAKRGKAFSEASKLITIAVKEGGSGDPGQNPRLRLALDKAREANMPKENIKRAIDKGLGRGVGGNLEEALYEGFGPGGVAMMVMVTTDNRNRTAAWVKSAFDKAGGNLAGPGAVNYMFSREGYGYKAVTKIPVDENLKQKVTGLVESLEESEDVDSVFTNME